jgi:uncharacterized protein (TIGR02466 family)
MKKELVRLFAIPILITKYQLNFQKELNYIEKKLKLVNNGTNKNFKSIDSYILKNKIFKNLENFFKDSLSVYDKEIFNTEQKALITQSWINFNPKGSIHHEHMHPNSIVSGVFYFQVDPAMPPIVFNKTLNQSLKRQVNKYNEFNSENFLLPVNSGELVLFPSSVRHSVPINTTNKNRISLSFNTFVSDTLGSDNELTKLNIKEISKQKS